MRMTVGGLRELNDTAPQHSGFGKLPKPRTELVFFPLNYVSTSIYLFGQFKFNLFILCKITRFLYCVTVKDENEVEPLKTSGIIVLDRVSSLIIIQVQHALIVPFV